jgi:diketogulonate reductase-like aldo/keto reductase
MLLSVYYCVGESSCPQCDAITCYSAKFNPLTDPVVRKIAEDHKKTPAQVLLHHCIQREIVVIPKSINPGRIKENFQVTTGVYELTDTGIGKHYRF